MFSGKSIWLLKIAVIQVYNQEQIFNCREVFSEYGGNGFYYRQANSVMPGIYPEEYDFHVDPELTCTNESYMGQSIDLLATDFSMGRD